jgi:hypothetical protein
MDTNVEGYIVRKWFEFFEECVTNEMGVDADGEPIAKFGVGVVIKNPYANKFSQNLSLLTEPSRRLGEAFGKRLVRAASGYPIRSYGKSCVVGVSGEYEHGNACLTTAFANPVREAIGGGQAWIPSTGKIGSPGTAIDIPLAHKDALYVRSHYDTVTVSVHDAPRANEILVLFAGASRGRLHARLGGLDQSDVKGDDGLH